MPKCRHCPRKFTETHVVLDDGHRIVAKLCRECQGLLRENCLRFMTGKPMMPSAPMPVMEFTNEDLAVNNKTI